MKDFTKYANFAKGTFYISATLIMVASAYTLTLTLTDPLCKVLHNGSYVKCMIM